MVRVEEEQTFVRQELEAWESFREEVRLTRPAAVRAGRGRTAGTSPQTSTAYLRERYKESVMSSSDYEEQYGDTVDESLREEFSNSIAEGLSSDGQLRPEMRRDLLVATSDRISEREEYLRTLRAETDSLLEGMRKVNGIESQLDSIHPPTDATASLEVRIEAWSTLEDLEAECQRVASERQQFLLGELRSQLGSNTIPFTHYLYGTTGSRHPVLRAVADTLHRIDEHRTGTRFSELRG